jgi:acetolactate synthase-1/2/3 large subunit
MSNALPSVAPQQAAHHHQPSWNGAQALVRTLLDSGVDVCFGNPGTSEMHFVAALDQFPQMRGVLCLFEGVATGAADGYGRMAGRPAATLLHLGPGLANGLANLHNARRAYTPVLNLVGDHATHHKPLDAPLESDIDAAAGTVSTWVRRAGSVESVAEDGAAAVAAALRPGPGPDRTGTSGSVATLIVPADISWSAGARPVPPHQLPAVDLAPEATIVAAAETLRIGRRTVLLLGGAALTEEGLRAVNRIQQATSARALAEFWPARIRRGAGIPAVPALSYRGEEVRAQLNDAQHLVLVGARRPVASFAYPGQDGRLTPPDAKVHQLAGPATDVVDALTRLADLVAPGVEPVLAGADRPPLPSGVLTAQNWADVIGALLPAEAIVSDESITAGMATLGRATAGAPAHDVLGLTGLAIGQGLPVAVGAAIACPHRPVVCLQADGSAMYTLTALWTQAREALNVTTVLLNNRSYAILRAELERVGAADGRAAARMLDLTEPDLDFVALATGMGVPATRATTAEELAEQFRSALAENGPHLIEAVLTADA